MSDTTPSSNSQTATTTPATQTGPTSEELQARIAELEKSREGILRDVQEERRKRQELETKLTPPIPTSAGKPDEDELGKVLKPYLDPVRQEAQTARAQLAKYEEDRALELMAQRLSKTKAEILADKALQERFTATARRWGVTGVNTSDVTAKTLDLMALEDMREKEAERVRTAKASESGSLPPGAPPAPNLSKKEFSPEEWDKLPLHEYEKLAANGKLLQDPQTGNIVYTPN